MICAGEITNSPPLWSSYAVSRMVPDDPQGGGDFCAFSTTIYLLRMANVPLEIVDVCLAPGHKPLCPGAIRGCTIHSTCMCHFVLSSGAPNLNLSPHLSRAAPRLTCSG